MAGTTTPNESSVRRRAGRVQLVLVRLLAHDLGRLRLARVSVWLCRSAALGYAGVIVWSALETTDTTLVLLRQGIELLSWLAGLSALAVAGPKRLELMPRERMLLDLRGVGSERLENAEWAAASATVLKALAAPSLALALVPVLLCQRWALVVRAGLATLGVAGYVLCFSILLGIGAHFARELSPKRGRSLFALVVLVPLLAGRALPIPSVPGFFASLLEQCLGLGSV